MASKRNKVYEKKILLASKATRQHLAEDAKAKSRARAFGSDSVYQGHVNRTASKPVSDENLPQPPGTAAKRSSVSYRTHPYHKPTWDKYPNIEISKMVGTEVGGRHNDNKSLNRKMQELRRQVQEIRKKESFILPDKEGERSLGNVSIRKVLASLYKKNTDSLYYRVCTISLPWIIKQIARFSLLWEVLIYFTIMTTFALTCFSAFFSFYEKVLWDWISIADVVFAADTILRLSVETWRYHTRATVVVFTAPYTMLQFLFDMSSMIPLHQIYYWTEGSSELGDLSMIDYFRLNRFFRLTRCKKFFEVLERERMANEKLLFIFKFSNYYLAFLYFTACLLVSCIGVQPMDYLLYNNLEKLEESFLKGFQQNKAGYGSTPWDIFVITTNFATAVITTVGYGDVVPNNEFEMTICIVCMLFGAIFLSGYYTSEMTNFRLELDGARFDLYHRLNQIRDYLKSMNTLEFFNSKVEEYYNYLWRYREGVFDVPFMRKFPRTFHEELLQDICLEMFDKSQLFYNLDAAFLRAISKTVTVALYNSNMLLCPTGAHSGKMYYILQGECQAMSKLNPSNPSAIIRAGSIIGEANLFFSFPYTTTVETRTCCQFIMLTKQDFLDVLSLFPIELEILRSRSLGKIKELYDSHQAYGVDPVCWVKTKSVMENPSNFNVEKLRRKMKRGSGLNQDILEDVVDDSNEQFIFSMPCEDRSVEKNHLIPYISCSVPEILNSKMEWIRSWNYFIMSLSIYFAFFAPYCLVFPESTKFEFYVCRIQYSFRYFVFIVFVLDVFVEILGACPVAGMYYKFWDGLGVVLNKPTFYLDVLAAIPLELWTNNHQDLFHVVGTTLKICKLWKVIRFIQYLDNVYPLQLFWFRLLQTIICLLYGIHFIACISYFIACPRDEVAGTVKCKQMSWLASYEIRFRMYKDPNEKIPVELKKNTLGYRAPYMYSFFYATATFTSAGFGDFNPQNRLEMLWAIGFQLMGFFLLGYCTSVLTSALSCLVRSKLVLQQQLVSLYQFMNHYHLREHLKDRIIEYFVLQHQLRGGVPLDGSTHIMYDAPAYLRNDVLYLEVHELLDGIPVFSKVEADVIIKLSSSMKLFLIPPNTTFVYMGEVRRILYVIKNGSMGIFEPGDVQPIAVLEASSHFGIRDLLFGEPSHYIIRSLSYVAMYEIKQDEFEEALQYEDDFWDLVKSEKQRIKQVIHEMTLIYASMGRTVSDHDRATRIPSWIKVPSRIPSTHLDTLSPEEAAKIAKVNLLNDEFDEVYYNVKWSIFFKYLLLRKTIHPVGLFSKFWNCVMSIICCFTVLSLTLETFCYIRMPWFRAFQMSLDLINYVDIYLKMHWSYYNPHNHMLVTHPLKTAVHYCLHGSLVMDVAICAPVELLIWLAGLTNFLGYGKAASWYSKLRWIRLFQFKRIPIVFEIVHNIFKQRRLLLLSLYVIVTLFVCTMVSTVALFIACPWEANDWREGDQYKIPLCSGMSWVGYKYEETDTNPEVISGFFRRWILGLYYVSQVILVVGFGDMIILDQSDVFLLIFMCIFGFIFMRCMAADMTAAEVDSDQARADFTEQITVLDLVMKREKVPKKLYSAVMSHLSNTWNRSRGLQPRELFGELHPMLESELYGNLVEEKLLKVPLFHSFPRTVLRSIFRYMKTMYINRGDRIMRFGNLEYEMYIIISGKVYITDQHLNYFCSLGPGETFGETSMIYGMPRRHNAIAACNSEIYVLTAHHFEMFLGRYPNFKNEMKLNLSSEKQDYFETAMEKKMEVAKGLTAEQKHKMLTTFAERTNLIKDMVAQKEDFEHSGLDIAETKLRKRNAFFGRGDLDENLPLFYLAVKSKKRRFMFYPVIHPKCWLIRTFNVYVAWLCFFTPAIATYEVCFSSDFLSSERHHDTASFSVTSALHKISDVIEITFLVHIVLNFFLAFEVKNGLYNKSPRSIVMRYLTSFDGFVIDMITCVPFIIEKTLDVIGLDFSDFSEDLELVFENLYLLRSIRLYHYFKNILSKRNDLTVSTFRLQITISVTSFCLMAHMLACLFYWISPCTRPDLTNGMVKFPNLCPAPTEGLDKSAWTTQYVKDKEIATNKEKLDAWRWWFRSLYWVVTTISTTGFGDIVPVTINEMAVGVICMLCGAFILSIILSQFTSGMASLTRTRREYMYQVNLLVKHLKNIGLSATRQTQVMMYFRTLWESCRGVPYHKSWRKLPLTMQIEVAYALFGKTLSKVPLFKDSKEKIFIRQLSNRVTHSLYIPGSYIHKDGDPGTSMFVVFKGVVSGTLMMTNNEPELRAIYNPGDAFGRFAAFFHDGVYKKSYRAETMVEILEVKQNDILHLTRKFPQLRKILFNFIATKYEPRGANVNIFDRKRRKGQFFGFKAEFQFAAAAARKAHTEDIASRRHKKKHKRKDDVKSKKQMVEDYLKQERDREKGDMEPPRRQDVGNWKAVEEERIRQVEAELMREEAKQRARDAEELRKRYNEEEMRRIEEGVMAMEKYLRSNAEETEEIETQFTKHENDEGIMGERQEGISQRESERVAKSSKKSGFVPQSLRKSEGMTRRSKKSEDMAKSSRISEVVARSSRKSEEMAKSSRKSVDMVKSSRKSEQMAESSRKSLQMPKPSRRSTEIGHSSRKSDEMTKSLRNSEAMQKSSRKSVEMPESSRKSVEMLGSSRKSVEVPEGSRKSVAVTERSKKSVEVPKSLVKTEKMMTSSRKSSRKSDDVPKLWVRIQEMAKSSRKDEEIEDSQRRTEDMLEGSRKGVEILESSRKSVETPEVVEIPESSRKSVEMPASSRKSMEMPEVVEIPESSRRSVELPEGSMKIVDMQERPRNSAELPEDSRKSVEIPVSSIRSEWMPKASTKSVGIPIMSRKSMEVPKSSVKSKKTARSSRKSDGMEQSLRKDEEMEESRMKTEAVPPSDDVARSQIASEETKGEKKRKSKQKKEKKRRKSEIKDDEMKQHRDEDIEYQKSFREGEPARIDAENDRRIYDEEMQKIDEEQEVPVFDEPKAHEKDLSTSIVEDGGSRKSKEKKKRKSEERGRKKKRKSGGSEMKHTNDEHPERDEDEGKRSEVKEWITQVEEQPREEISEASQFPDQLPINEEDKREKHAEERRRNHEEEKRRKDDERHQRKLEEEERRRHEEESQRKFEEEERRRHEEESQRQFEEKERRRHEQESQRKLEEEKRRRDEEEILRKYEEEQRIVFEEEKRRRDEEEHRIKFEQRRRDEEQERKREDEEERRKFEEEERKNHEEEQRQIDEEETEHRLEEDDEFKMDREEERRRRKSDAKEEKKRRKSQIEDEIWREVAEEEAERFRRKSLEKEALRDDFERRRLEEKERIFQDKIRAKDEARQQRREERERRKSEERERRRDERERLDSAEREERREERQRRLSEEREDRQKRRSEIEDEAWRKLTEQVAEKVRRKSEDREEQRAEWERKKQEDKERLWLDKIRAKEEARQERREERQRRKSEERERRQSEEREWRSSEDWDRERRRSSDDRERRGSEERRSSEDRERRQSEGRGRRPSEDREKRNSENRERRRSDRDRRRSEDGDDRRKGERDRRQSEERRRKSEERERRRSRRDSI